jgi:hypothetical protein
MNAKLLYACLPLFFLSESTFSKEGYLDPYWFSENYEKSIAHHNLDSIDDFLSDYIASLESIGQKDAKSTHNFSWGLSGFQTSLALGLSGKLGLFSWGGTKTFEIDWAQKKTKHIMVVDNKNVMPFDETTTEEDINSNVQFIVGKISKSGRVQNEKKLTKKLKNILQNFHFLGESLSLLSFRGWSPQKLRLDLGIYANGKIVYGPFVKLGGEIRLRLEWKNSLSRRPKIAHSPKKELKTFFEEMGLLLFSTLPHLENRSFSLDSVEIGIGIDAKGKVAIAELGGYAIPSIFFKKKNDYNKIMSLPPNFLEGNLPILISRGQEKSLFSHKRRFLKFKKRRIQKGLRKAFKFSHKFIEKVNSKINPKGHWKIKKLKSQYKFSLGGSLGPVKISGKPHLAFYFKNNSK